MDLLNGGRGCRAIAFCSEVEIWDSVTAVACSCRVLWPDLKPCSAGPDYEAQPPLTQLHFASPLAILPRRPLDTSAGLRANSASRLNRAQTRSQDYFWQKPNPDRLLCAATWRPPQNSFSIPALLCIGVPGFPPPLRFRRALPSGIGDLPPNRRGEHPAPSCKGTRGLPARKESAGQPPCDTNELLPPDQRAFHGHWNTCNQHYFERLHCPILPHANTNLARANH